MSNTHLYKYWRLWRALNSETTWDQSHLKGNIRAVPASSSSSMYAFPNTRANHHWKADFKGSAHTLEIPTPAVAMEDPPGIQFNLMFMAVFVLMLNYNSESRIAVTNLGASWETMMAPFPFGARRDFSIQNWKCVQWNKKTLTQNPPQTYRCESLHPNAPKKFPNINHNHLKYPKSNSTTHKKRKHVD